jgi:hypothetical protein
LKWISERKKSPASGDFFSGEPAKEFDGEMNFERGEMDFIPLTPAKEMGSASPGNAAHHQYKALSVAFASAFWQSRKSYQKEIFKCGGSLANPE